MDFAWQRGWHWIGQGEEGGREKEGEGVQGEAARPLLAARFPLGLHHSCEHVLRTPHEFLTEFADGPTLVHKSVEIPPHFSLPVDRRHVGDDVSMPRNQVVVIIRGARVTVIIIPTYALLLTKHVTISTLLSLSLCVSPPPARPPLSTHGLVTAE